MSFLFGFGAYLENKTLKKTRSAIKALVDMAPAKAYRIEYSGARPKEVGIDELNIGDLLVVKPGGQIPVDGTITHGSSYIDESAISGEPIPSHKSVGDQVFAGTIVDSGSIEFEAKKIGQDTTFAKIIELVEEAQDSKSQAEKFIDSFARYYTPGVIVLSLLVYIFTSDIPTAITVLVLGCPGALVIGTPVANVSGIGRAAKDHILLKGAESISNFSKTDVFVFDKTGTLTIGQPKVDEIAYYTDDEDEALRILGLVVRTSDHPLAKSIVRYIEDKSINLEGKVESTTLKGLGLKSTYKNSHILVGNERLMEENQVPLSDEQKSYIKNSQKMARSIVILAKDQKVLAIAGISDQIKEDAGSMVKNLKALGIKETLMLTGDNKNTARAVADAIGIDQVHYDLLPQDKLEIVRDLQAKDLNVAFVGDGINDSPALSQAQTGIAMGQGTDVAIETSDVVLVKNDLESVVRAIVLSQKTIQIMRQNIIIAVGVVIFLLIGLILGYANMSIGMLVHEGSILVVILNAMRLLR